MSSTTERFCANGDVLAELICHFDETSLHSFLLTSKRFATATVPRLYRNLPIKPNQPSTFLDLSPISNFSNFALWTKREAWKHVRTLSIHTHGETFCPGLLSVPSPSPSPSTSACTLPDLPNLQTIHLAGGDRPIAMGKECPPHSCPLLQHYKTSPTLRHLIIRKLCLLPSTPISRLTIILRPCQLPFDPHGKSSYSPATFGQLCNLEQCDVVLWDEKHDHRLEWNYHAPSTPPHPQGKVEALERRWGGYMPHQVLRTRGCAYCDMQGCVRYTPNVPKQLPGVVFALCRVTGVKKVGVWNVDKSMEMFQWWDSKVTLEEGRRGIVDEAKRGRKERREVEHGEGGVDAKGEVEAGRLERMIQEDTEQGRAVDGEDLTMRRNERDTVDGVKGEMEGEDDDVTVDFGSAQEWLDKVHKDGLSDMIMGEEEYCKEVIEGSHSNPYVLAEVNEDEA